MKYSYLIICVLIFSACTGTGSKAKPEEQTAAKDAGNSSATAQSTGVDKWQDNFRKFSEAVVSADKEAVKLFIDFPIQNDGNEIWWLADPRLVEEMNMENIKPFTEADFDRYFASIFPMDFRKTLEGLNLEQFVKTGQAASPEIEVVKDFKSTLGANYDKATQKMILILTTKVQDISETSVLYQFDIIQDGKIKLRQVRIAG